MTHSQRDGYKGNILVVDDTPDNLRLIVNLLAEKGYKVRATPSGKLALAGIHLSYPDLILLDIMMPDMNGYEVCQQLKADELTRDIPVIFISAIDEVLDKVKAFAVGGVDYITKPFHIEEVLARVETHLALRSLQKNIQQKNYELSQTLDQLKTTQNQLIQSEKMAALGQLIAGIAHEINTPLASIRSSIGNIADFLTQDIKHLKGFFQELSAVPSPLLALLIDNSKQAMLLSTKEKRQLKKELSRHLELQNIKNSNLLADIFVKIGINNDSDIKTLLHLVKDPNNQDILKNIYSFISLQKSINIITTATNRAAQVVIALKTYARYDHSGEKIQVNITEGIDTALTIYHNQFKRGVEVIKNYDGSPSLLCYPDELNQVWTNLVHNALQAMNYKGTLKIDVKQQDTTAIVSITDSGLGIPPEIMPKIFTPFFTTKPPGEGSGLGLDIVKKIIDKHHGQIQVESVPGQTTFTIFLPTNLTEQTSHV